MTVNRVLLLAILLAASQVWAYPEPGTATLKPTGGAKAPAPVPAPAGPDAGLIPRTPLPKTDVVVRPPDAERLCIKFRDDLRVRVQADKSLRSTTAGLEPELQAIAARHNLTFTPAIQHTPVEQVEAILQRAREYSGRAQPDLLGMMYIEGPEANLQAAANELVKLGSVETVYFMRRVQPYGPPTGACCVGNVCSIQTELDCGLALGTYQGDGTTCDPDPCSPPPPELGACCLAPGECADMDEAACLLAGGVFFPGECKNQDCQFDCGLPELPSCFEAHPTPACNDAECCELVGQFRPFCVEDDGEWDELCVALANFLCDTEIGADRCNTPFNEHCFEVHTPGGCLDTECCEAVCDLDPFCCSGFWGPECVELALMLCNPPEGSGQTPDFVELQGYLRASSYLQQFGGIPDGIPLPAPLFLPPYVGYGGEGMAMFGEGPSIFETVRLRDDPNMSIASGRYQGVYGLGRELHEVYGIGSRNGARGAGVKVAVIEWAYFKDHEDLDVTPEPGLTMILTEDISSPHHATACLGIINAKDDERGMVGIAPDADAYFFPLTSAETGPRYFDAFMSCYSTLGAGDVCSNSWGPAQNLNNDPFFNTLLRVGSDLGITMVIAAANSCLNLSDEEELEDTGAIVVGACYPGLPFCRLPFSNYFRQETDGSNTVHISAWGSLVAAPGYGELFYPNSNNNRAYTRRFGGTSAACPQIAGVAACFQGLAKQFYGIPLTPDRIRAAIMTDPFPQCGGGDLPGFPDEVDCGPDMNPEFEDNLINDYVRPRNGAAAILSQQFGGFDQSPNVQEIFILRGNHIFGNKFSVKGSDNNYFIVQSLQTQQTFIPNIGLPGSEVHQVASRATYLATGQTADVMVRAKFANKRPGNIIIQTELSSPDAINFLFVEAYDWTAQDWSFVGFNAIPPSDPGADFQFEFIANNADRFVAPSTRNVYVRFYILSSTTPATGSAGFGSVAPGTGKRFDLIIVRPAAANQFPL